MFILLSLKKKTNLYFSFYNEDHKVFVFSFDYTILKNDQNGMDRPLGKQILS
jgi:hypothetical protein